MFDDRITPRNPTLRLLAGVHPLPAEPDLGTDPSLHAYGVTDTGNVRSANEDQFLVAQTDRVAKVDWSSFGVEGGISWPVRREARILMVADGIGGHANGGLASAVAVDAMLEAITSLERLPASEDQLASALDTAVAHAQQRIFAVARRKALHFKPGTTLTLAYVDWPTMYVAHVGDSRCYLIRDSAIRQLTQDHTLAARLVEAGMTPEQAECSRSKHVLLNAVGGGTDELRVDLSRYELRAGDRVLLCTDGLHGMVPDNRLLSIIDGRTDLLQSTTDLVAAALEAGGTDNITAVLMHVSE